MAIFAIFLYILKPTTHTIFAADYAMACKVQTSSATHIAALKRQIYTNPNSLKLGSIVIRRDCVSEGRFARQRHDKKINNNIKLPTKLSPGFHKMSVWKKEMFLSCFCTV
ncbi:hypothetical protein PHYBLDRAFT_73403 [Phycomyces blakesleeanus NRRL 1555(-)]|uniref:Uncharacterized protein n=1 Tax=Phycomyces blakesleeanus (strain ATCC 8743b / DSM 1359 / FGSC 10004 / NBRC 33097 / NRRL 1555) TaxID=763407 RepID=A0A167L7P0_PHYB8|nr:hypothetical protein PHYBLDRAFT_73403 [Phycomyces blakesleeanus NRRL 1555(-)]OAD69777.1 hypothetical protein PHYBLDRAFT_73403 [Phycomyces blakesleeanus NRRL 1555(-)]|eukprot:XP_018287817.1 hypothetical protein PHYBLDRAFT_73403 [Phycomyces blakesleeanus NRRL 1555(-)]